MPESALPELLRELRENKGKSLRSTASELGVNPSYLSRLETGRKAPSPAFLNKVARLYAVPQEMLDLAEGRLPQDIVEIFQENPTLLDEFRQRYASG
jgi:transcriptional regulator with XRE-family HTH domain